MKFDELEILEHDFDIFVALDDPQKIEFLFDAITTDVESSVVKQLSKFKESYIKQPIKQKVSTEDIQFGPWRLSITLTKDEVHLNSDSLKAIRKFLNKMWNDGLILWPSSTKKSEFDMYRYFKAYKIIGQPGPLSSN
jgi:hypothetical protein